MSVAPGTYRLGPDDATLAVHTTRAGAAAKAGHDLLIWVTAWNATLVVADDPAATTLELAADPTSLRVQEGHGGIQALDAGDIDNIHQTIDDEVLERREIAFRSSRVEPAGDQLHFEGELTLYGSTGPIAFDVATGYGGTLTASAVLKQSDWGMKPYSALFGALKVADEVRLEVEGHLPAPA